MISAGDTIFALASGAGRAAVAVVRLSGPASGAALDALAGRRPPARAATLRRLRDPADGRPLDSALVLWFPGPSSFTGEDCAELHCHGGRAVMAAVLAALAALPRCRLATPGEFTRRAYLNGRMDLAEVEGLADLIDAQTEAQRRQALRQMEGALGAWVAVQRERLLQALAAVESAIDFADEGDVAGDFGREASGIVAVLIDTIGVELERARGAERLREGFVVVIAGPPNAGKSTLLNALARREVAIVSPQAGTTRDPIQVDLDLGGQLVHLVDTAGLREAAEGIEREGIARALQRARSADLVLWLHEARHPCPTDPALGGAPVWTVATKADLASNAGSSAQHVVSAISGDGLPALLASLTTAAAGGVGDGAVATQLRHRRALVEGKAALEAIQAGGDALGLELMADGLRGVIDILQSLVGRIEAEDVLGTIFARFCVGK